MATKVLQYFKLEIPIIALAKKNEEIYKPNVKESIKLPEDSEAMFILKTIRDEAHRFAINENRRLRLKKMRLLNGNTSDKINMELKLELNQTRSIYMH